MATASVVRVRCGDKCYATLVEWSRTLRRERKARSLIFRNRGYKVGKMLVRIEVRLVQGRGIGEGGSSDLAKFYVICFMAEGLTNSSSSGFIECFICIL